MGGSPLGGDHVVLQTVQTFVLQREFQLGVVFRAHKKNWPTVVSDPVTEPDYLVALFKEFRFSSFQRFYSFSVEKWNQNVNRGFEIVGFEF